jgi:hypothetical protein
MKHIFHIALSLFVLVGLTACEEDFGTFNRDNRPEVPLMFTNATSFGHDPFVVVSQNDQIEFVMEIPENSGRTITEIRKVAAGSTAINIATLNNSGDYVAEPIPGNGNRVTFTTTLAEFREKRPTTTVIVPSSGFVEIAFLFEVILDNNESIVSMRARARISQ